MATVTKLKAELNNKNLPILGEDGNLYSYYFGRYFNKIVEKGYTPTSGEITALEAFIQDGINNGWIDIVKYFLPLIGDSSHLDVAAVPLIDEVGNYEMAEYTGTENFTNSFDVSNNKVKYYTRVNNGGSVLKTPCTVELMNGGISFSGYIRTPEVFNGDSSIVDNYATIKNNTSNNLILGVRYQEVINGVQKLHQIVYRVHSTDADITPFAVYFPSTDIIENLNATEKSLVINYGFYKDNGETKRLRNFLDADNNKNYLNGSPESPITYDDYSSNTNKMVFGSTYNEVPLQKFGCLGVLNAKSVTQSLIESYNNAVFTLMTALGK